MEAPTAAASVKLTAPKTTSTSVTPRRAVVGPAQATEMRATAAWVRHTLRLSMPCGPRVAAVDRLTVLHPLSRLPCPRPVPVPRQALTAELSMCREDRRGLLGALRPPLRPAVRFLRLATTSQRGSTPPPWLPAQRRAQSQSSVTTLRPRLHRLRPPRSRPMRRQAAHIGSRPLSQPPCAHRRRLMATRRQLTVPTDAPCTTPCLPSTPRLSGCRPPVGSPGRLRRRFATCAARPRAGTVEPRASGRPRSHDRLTPPPRGCLARKAHKARRVCFLHARVRRRLRSRRAGTGAATARIATWLSRPARIPPPGTPVTAVRTEAEVGVVRARAVARLGTRRPAPPTPPKGAASGSGSDS